MKKNLDSDFVEKLKRAWYTRYWNVAFMATSKTCMFDTMILRKHKF